jgi:hypothetical protein
MQVWIMDSVICDNVDIVYDALHDHLKASIRDGWGSEVSHDDFRNMCESLEAMIHKSLKHESLSEKSLPAGHCLHECFAKLRKGVGIATKHIEGPRGRG